MKNFCKMLEENDIFSLKYLDESDDRYDDECKQIISYVKKHGQLSASGIFEECGYKAMLKYMCLCNSHRKRIISGELQKHLDYIR